MTEFKNVFRKAMISPTSCVHEAIRVLEAAAIQILLIVDEDQHLLGTLSDGDIRRGFLSGLSLDSSIGVIIHRSPLVVPEGVDRDLILQIMAANKIRQIPIVDEKNRLMGLHLWDELAAPQVRLNPVVIMAGGLGTRLRPFTNSCPKPMLPLAGKPMIHHVIDRAKMEGFNHFILAINYLGNVIEDYFEDGKKFGINIEYIREEKPLGTAGALSLLDADMDLPFIVINGDVITDIRYGELIDFHNRYEAIATMAVRLHEWQHPFGVVQMNGVDIIGIEEKPVAKSHINAGVYVLDPSALKILEMGEHCDMPNLFEFLRESNQRTVAYPMHEPWLDVGRPADLEKANDSLGAMHRSQELK